MFTKSQCVRLFQALLVISFFWTGFTESDELEAVTGKPEVEDFSLKDLHGDFHRLSDYRGSGVLVSFWATWCPQCIWEMPSLQALSNSLPTGKLIVLGVNVGENPTIVQAFAEQNSITFPILLDQDLETYKKWPVLGVPTSFLIDGEGKLAYMVVGAIEWTEQQTLSKIKNLIARD